MISWKQWVQHRQGQKELVSCLSTEKVLPSPYEPVRYVFFKTWLEWLIPRQLSRKSEVRERKRQLKLMPLVLLLILLSIYWQQVVGEVRSLPSEALLRRLRRRHLLVLYILLRRHASHCDTCSGMGFLTWGWCISGSQTTCSPHETG